jgi:hypothetical protein
MIQTKKSAGIFASLFSAERENARMKMFAFGPMALILAFTLFFCGCANQSGQIQGTQQNAAAATPTPRPPDFRHSGGMGMRRGY